MSEQGRVYEGKLKGDGLSFGIVVARFNEFISSRLLSGALDSLVRHGADPAKVEVAWVPGAFEIPLVAGRMAHSGRYDAVLCLGAVIRGSTPHFDYVAAEVSKGLTTDTIEQAVERAGTKAGNKGWDAATSALEMANLLKGMHETGL